MIALGFYLGGGFVLALWLFSIFRDGGLPDYIYSTIEAQPVRAISIFVGAILLWPIYLPCSFALHGWKRRAYESEKRRADRMRRCLGDEGCDGAPIPGTTLCPIHTAFDEPVSTFFPPRGFYKS